MTKLDVFLDLIKDGAWHSLTELSKTLAINPKKLVEMSKSLAEQGLVKYKEKAKWVKINPEWRTIFSKKEEEKIEHKPAVATVIIPTKESITIQKIHITNTTEKDVELWIKTCKKRVELAISKIN